MGVLDRFLADEAATQLLGDDIAAALQPGDVLALHGDLGAGKTTLARAIVRALAGDQALEVPSPTFTLVQSYETRLPVAHFDLYRLASPDELDELGFEEAAATSVVLVEWPEHAGDRLPAGAIHVRLTEQGRGRRAEISAEGTAFARIERSLAIRTFLEESGWGDARREYLLGDASTRAYETVERGGPDRILMNAPRRPDGPPIRDGRPYSQIAKLAESVTPFVAIARALKKTGFAVPEIHSADLDRGLLLIEHLGGGGFLDPEGKPVAERYKAAAKLLADLHAIRWSPVLPVAPGIDYTVPAYDDAAMRIETELLTDWYLPYLRGTPADARESKLFTDSWAAVFARLRAAETSLVLRDYHSPNLIWRPEKKGRDRLGIIDFQDALIGPSAYDVASLAMDARVTVPPQLEAETVEAYCEARRTAGAFDRDAFEAAYAIMAAQRNSKIIGIFVRLDQRDGKPQYLKHLPRIRDYIERALPHPALAPVREVYRRLGIVGDV